MDGRKLPNPDDVNPTYLGYSVAHWDGDTLVIESNGFNDRTWLDASGHPHGEQLKVTEKLTRTDFNNIKVEATIDDPEYYTKPWTVVTGITWTPNTTGPFTMRGGESWSTFARKTIGIRSTSTGCLANSRGSHEFSHWPIPAAGLCTILCAALLPVIGQTLFAADPVTRLPDGHVDLGGSGRLEPPRRSPT